MKDSPGRWEPPPERWPPGRSDDAWNQSGQIPNWNNPATLLPAFSYRRPQRPRSIQRAVALMRVSAIAVLGLGFIPSLMSTGGSGLGLYAGLNGIIGSVPFAALWWWMASANKTGQRWARTTATVFFGINALGGAAVWLELEQRGAFSASAFAATTGFYLVVSLVFLLLGLTAIVLLWTRKSSDYYDAMSMVT
jgi:hypothetical protein